MRIQKRGVGALQQRSSMIRTAFEEVPDCEQVGFIETICEGSIWLEMMGYEFWGNASLSAASWQAYQDGLEPGQEAVISVDSSGIDGALAVRVRRLDNDSNSDRPHFTGTIMMPRPEVGSFAGHPVVHMDGISHMIINEEEFTSEEAEDKIRGFADDMGLDALGIILCDIPRQDAPLPDIVTIRPLVYVRDSDTLVWEHGCASGSTAVGYYLYQADNAHTETQVRQPGGVISINIKNGQPELTGHVILRQF